MTGATPGCFTIPSVFNFQSRTCKACVHLISCQQQSRAKLVALSPQSKSVLIQRLIKEHEGFERNNLVELGSLKLNLSTQFMPDSEMQSVVNAMPATAGKYLLTLLKKGVQDDLKEALSTGKNPFSEFGQRGAFIAAEHLREASGFSRVSLTRVIQEKLGWARNSAGSHAAILWHCFLALGIIEKSAGDPNWAVLAAPYSKLHTYCSLTREVS